MKRHLKISCYDEDPETDDKLKSGNDAAYNKAVDVYYVANKESPFTHNEKLIEANMWKKVIFKEAPPPPCLYTDNFWSSKRTWTDNNEKNTTKNGNFTTTPVMKQTRIEYITITTCAPDGAILIGTYPPTLTKSW